MFTLLVLFVSCAGVLSGALKIVDDIPNLSPTGLNEAQKGDIPNLPPPGGYPECEPNEVLSLGCVPPCGGEDSCYDHDEYACLDVVEPCAPRCVCKEGFIRKTQGRECIPKDECEGPCELFTHYTDCKQSSKESCSSIANPPKADEACKPGCTCLDGYYRKNETEPCHHRCLCPQMKNSEDCKSWIRVF